MAARSRPRGQLKEEFDEERVIWNSIKSDGRRVDQLMVCDISIKAFSLTSSRLIHNAPYNTQAVHLLEAPLAMLDLRSYIASSSSDEKDRRGGNFMAQRSCTG